MKKRILFIFLSAILLGMTACNKSFNKVMKNPDPKFRLEKAYEYYNQGKYEKAQPLFEEHLTLNKGIKNSEEVLFLYAYCYYYLKDYTLGAFYFRNFMTSYPRSEKVEEAAYMMAVCYEKESPRESLDQTNTVKAIDQYQSFANRFPNSAKIHDANEAIDRLRAKIEGKAYKSAYLYYKIKEYKAASVALKALLKDYPGIENQDKIQYYIIKSNKYYADNSASSKKYERYEETAKECTTFREKYQGSQYLTEVNDIYLKTVAQLKIYKDYEYTRKKDGRN